MPLYPDQRHCQTPGCIACALRDAYHGRSPGDDEFGRRSAGVPQGDLKTLKLGNLTHPLTETQLEDIANQIVDEHQHLLQNMTELFQAIYHRDSHPVTCLLLLEGILQKLTPRIAHNLFDAQLEAHLKHYPAESRQLQRIQILEEVKNRDPFLKLLRLRQIIEGTAEKTTAGSA